AEPNGPAYEGVYPVAPAQRPVRILVR
ncbi:hypothetical protein GA0115255_123891, partial [Streptomyces sp. Ncost-T6T-2b]